MSVLVQLPDDLCGVLLSEWLQIKEVGILDSAMCSNEVRPELLHQLKEIRQVSNRFRYRSVFIDWLTERGVKLYELHWFKNGFPAVTNQKDNVRVIFIPSSHRSNQAYVVNMFSQLHTLVCADNGVNLSLVDNRILNRLQSLEIIHCCSEDNLVAIRDHCRSLTSLHCSNASHQRKIVMEILRCNPQLQSVHLNLNDASLDILIVYCCKSLRSITTYGNITSACVQRLLKQCLFLKQVNINGEQYIFKYERQSLKLNIDGEAAFVLTGRTLKLAKLSWRRVIGMDDVHVQSLMSLCSSSLQELSLNCKGLHSSTLIRILQVCSELKVLTYVSKTPLEWRNILAGDCKLVQVDLDCTVDEALFVIQTCRYLTAFTCACTESATKDVHLLVQSIASYRHCVTGLALKSESHFSKPNGMKETWFICFDGKNFSGDYWEELTRDGFDVTTGEVMPL